MPFQMHGYYASKRNPVDLFGSRFRESFHENYRKCEHSRHFDIWRHRLKAGTAGRPAE
jgi:hypothetical protein